MSFPKIPAILQAQRLHIQKANTIRARYHDARVRATARFDESVRKARVKMDAAFKALGPYPVEKPK